MEQQRYESVKFQWLIINILQDKKDCYREMKQLSGCVGDNPENGGHTESKTGINSVCSETPQSELCPRHSCGTPSGTRTNGADAAQRMSPDQGFRNLLKLEGGGKSHEPVLPKPKGKDAKEIMKKRRERAICIVGRKFIFWIKYVL